MPTKIEWAMETINSLLGCSHVSEGCRHCYAKGIAARNLSLKYRGLTRRGKWTGEVRSCPEAWDVVEHWRKPRMVFVDSMGDFFHEGHSLSGQLTLLRKMWKNKKHTFLLLTKRIENAAAVLESARHSGIAPWPIPNVWLGVTAENQKAADERIPILLQIPAAVRFVSVEPMLGPVDLHGCDPHCPELCEDHPELPERAPCRGRGMLGKLDWVICGGESGPGARPMHPDWARSLRDECQAADVPFFFKQWGAWTHYIAEAQKYPRAFVPDGIGGRHAMWRVGKKKAGRLLDGREWNEYPEEAR